MWSKLPTPVRGALSHFTVGVLVLLAAYLYWKYAVDTPKPTGQQGPVQVAQPVKVIEKWQIKTVEVPGPPRLVVLPKAELATRLKMPELVSLDNGTSVISAVSVPPWAGPTTAVTTLSQSGVAETLLRREPMPFFSLKKEFEARARYLFVGINMAEAEVVARPLRVGPVEVEGGVGVEIRRQDSALGARRWIGATYHF